MPDRLSVAVSVLDRANSRAGETAADTLAGVVTRASHLEELGIRRLWVAEHHAVPGIVGSAPGLLMAAIAQATSTIRVGAGGFMVPARPPMMTAEQIATLEALFPGRIDGGLGASVGFTQAVRAALRQDAPAKWRYDDDVSEILGYLSGQGSVTMQPQPVADTPLFVLTGGSRAGFAGRMGLGLVLGGPKAADADAVAEYRREFRPSKRCAHPHAILSVSAHIAETADRAHDLALPEVWSLVLSRSTGAFDPLRPAAELDASALTDRERERLETGMRGVVYGTQDVVTRRLQAMVERVGVDELMITGATWDREAEARSDAAFAAISA